MIEFSTIRTRRLRASAGTGVTVVCAAATFAPNSFARLRLIRQLHASGLLSGDARSGDARSGERTARRELAGGSPSASC